MDASARDEEPEESKGGDSMWRDARLANRIFQPQRAEQSQRTLQVAESS